MDWSRGFHALFYASFVDGGTWGDVERFEITGGSISKTGENLKESANINCVSYQSFNERWIRVWMDTNQNGSVAHIPLFTGLAMNPSRSFNGTYETNTLTCFSVLKPVDDVLLPRGWYIRKGSDVRSEVLTLLEPTKAPIDFDDDPPQLANDIVAEEGETNLSMVNRILEAIKWRITIDGYGTIHIQTVAFDGSRIIEPPVKTFGDLENDVLELSVNVEHDWFNSPNVFRAISEGLTAIAKDEDPDSIYSTVSRGREIWMEETECVLETGETLADYAARRLKEEQQITYKVSYKRRFDPDVYVSDLVMIHYPSIQLNGYFKIDSQTVDLSGGAPTSEEAYLVG